MFFSHKMNMLVSKDVISLFAEEKEFEKWSQEVATQ